MANFSFNEWALQSLTFSREERWGLVQDILDEMAESKSKEMHELLKSITNSEEWTLIGLSVNLEYVPLQAHSSPLEIHKWRRPLLVLINNKIPLIAICGSDLEDADIEGKEFEKVYDGPMERLSWVKTMGASSSERKKEWIVKILESIISYREDRSLTYKGKALKNNPTKKELVYLSDALQNKNEWQMIGFSTNLQYVRVDHDEDEFLRYVYVHPWGTPPLLVKHTRLPLYGIAGAGIRWNDSVLREIKDNKMVDIGEGVTG